MPQKDFPVNKTVMTAVWEEKGNFTKEDIVKKLNKRSVCPHPIAVSTVETIISNISGTDLEVVSGGTGRSKAHYRNKVDYRLRLILNDIRAIEIRVKELIQEQKVKHGYTNDD